jgi:[ribosomal protein S5]-alanine N-acetyltransferase
VLSEGRVGLRPLRAGDAAAWVEVRQRNASWLGPWEATPPGGGPPVAASRPVFTAMRRSLHRQARLGEALPFGVTYDGRLAGQLTVAGIVRGSLNAGFAGYWIDEAVAGRGVMTTSLALVVDHCFGAVGLHRIEVNIRPENLASRRVVVKLGFREEGLRHRYLHIDGAYRDHLGYALTVEDVPGGLLNRWRASAPRG